jgi:hypothetical protein
MIPLPQQLPDYDRQVTGVAQCLLKESQSGTGRDIEDAAESPPQHAPA